jgi:galactokinase
MRSILAGFLCAAAVAALKVESLRDVSLQQLGSHEGELPGAVFKRARHIVTESPRVHSFVEASERGNLTEMGRLMVESHRSLQHDYEVSCEELDFLVDHALPLPGVYGARMTGGGFGGCTVTMLRPEALRAFRQQIAKEYAERFAVTPEFHECVPSAGASEVTKPEAIPPAGD